MDAAGTRPWVRDSLVQPYSVTKPFAAVCALLLVAQGRLDLDAPVQRYWPGFRAQADVRQLLSHQAGVVALRDPAPTELFYDWDALCRRLAEQEPAWTPGAGHGESALFYGHLVGELVRRVDGRTLGEFLRAEVTGRLGLDFAVGLTTAERARAVDLTGLDDAFRRTTAAGRPDLYRRSSPRATPAPRWRTSRTLRRSGSAPSTSGSVPRPRCSSGSSTWPSSATPNRWTCWTGSRCVPH